MILLPILREMRNINRFLLRKDKCFQQMNAQEYDELQKFELNAKGGAGKMPGTILSGASFAQESDGRKCHGNLPKEYSMFVRGAGAEKSIGLNLRHPGAQGKHGRDGETTITASSPNR